MKFEIGTMSVGDILDRGIKLLFSRLGTFLAINLIALSPLLIYQALIPLFIKALAGAGDASSGPQMAMLISFLVGSGVVVVFSLVLHYLVIGAVLRVISLEFVDQNVTVGEALRYAWHRFPALLGTSILVGLAVFAGMFLCIVGAIIFGLWYGVASQVVMVENLSGTRAMGRSKELTAGYRGKLFLLGFLIGLIALIIQLPVGMLEFVLPSQDRTAAATVPFMNVNYPNYLVNILVAFIAQVIVQSYSAICETLYYFDLRIRKEGYDLELAAKHPVPELQ